MSTVILKPIILITEGVTEASIIRSLINTNERMCYMVAAGGYHNIAATLRTQYLMHDNSYKYVAVFDSESADQDVRIEKLEMVRYYSKADYHKGVIGVFCFRDSLERELKIPRVRDFKRDAIIKVLKERAEQMKQCDTILEIQQFIDELVD